MGMPAVQDEWTVERALALPDDGNRYEVLSPSTARADRHRKRLIYQDQRVPEYWVVDLDARLVERWRPDDARAELMAERLEWQPRADLEPLRIDLPAFFDEVLGR